MRRVGGLAATAGSLLELDGEKQCLAWQLCLLRAEPCAAALAAVLPSKEMAGSSLSSATTADIRRTVTTAGDK